MGTTKPTLVNDLQFAEQLQAISWFNQMTEVTKKLYEREEQLALAEQKIKELIRIGDYVVRLYKITPLNDSLANIIIEDWEKIKTL